MKKIILPISMAFLLLTIGACTKKAVEQPTTKPDRVVSGMPVYTKFEDFKPNLYRDNDTTYVVNFWATWCKPCIEELPYFEDLYKNYKDKKVKVILVSIDDERKIEQKVIPFVQERNLQSELILMDDPQQNIWIDKVNKNWSGAIPATVIYQGEKRQFFEQSFLYEELEQAVLKFIN